MNRRDFCRSSLALGTMWALPAWAAPSRPLLKLGVISDVHIGARKVAPERLEFALRWLKTHDVEAVVCAGDVAHTGNIRELERFAEIWYTVFPDGKAADGHKVELMISTGNHDVRPYNGRWKGYSEERLLRENFNYADNLTRTWDRLFHDKWELVWRREVKGITFVGSQWGSLKPPIEAFMKSCAGTIPADRPFFYCQHAHPTGTCHGDFAAGCFDSGEATRALSAFPNAVAISGHSHCTLTDEKTVWQGAFTSIGAGCTHEGSFPFSYENNSAFWHPSFKQKLMAPLNDAAAWGGDPDGGSFELIDVYADHLVVHRRSSVSDSAIGPDWIVPIPARRDGPFDFAIRGKGCPAPQFASEAKLTVAECPKGHALESKARRGEACLALTFPAAAAGPTRALDYEVTVTAGDKIVLRRLFFARGGVAPVGQENVEQTCLLAMKDLPAERPVSLSVFPRNCFATAGRPLSVPLAN